MLAVMLPVEIAAVQYIALALTELRVYQLAWIYLLGMFKAKKRS